MSNTFVSASFDDNLLVATSTANPDATDTTPRNTRP